MVSMSLLDCLNDDVKKGVEEYQGSRDRIKDNRSIIHIPSTLLGECTS